ncbi:MAG: PAS domain S-box protein, partial [Nitrospinae bacterium]|nr:PAS domain S-box protein [Nitrospinota bacterium]
MNGSLNRRILLVTAAVALAVSTLFGVWWYLSLRSSEYARLDDDIENYTRSFLLAVRDPLFNFDDASIRSYLDSGLSGNAFFDGALIYQESDRRPYVGRLKGPDGTVVDIAAVPAGDHYRIERRPVLKEGSPVGRIELYFSDRRVWDTLSDAIGYLLVVVVALESALVLSLYLLLTRVITRPIRTLTDEVERAADRMAASPGGGDVATPLEGLGKNRADEIGCLHAAMARLFAERTRELEQANRRLSMVNASLETEVAERLLAQRQAQKSQQLYQDLFENANDVIYIHDMGGVFQSVNAALCRLTAYTPEELIGAPISKLLTPEQLALAQESMATKLSGDREMTTYELEVNDRFGAKIPVEVSTRLIRIEGRPVGVQGIARDLRERKRAEAALRESEKKLRSVINTTVEGFVYMDGEGRLVEANNALLEMTGYTREEVLGSSWLGFFPQESITQMAAIVADRASSEHRTYDTMLKARGGVLIPVIIHATSVTDPGGAFTGSFAFITDISHLKKTQEELIVAKETAESATLLKNKFIGLVSHDLRAPLAVIRQLMEYALDADENPRPGGLTTKNVITRAVDSADGLLRLIDQLLDLSRLQTGNITVTKRFFSPHAVVEAQLNYLSYGAEKKRVFIRNEIPRSVRLYADVDLYSEVIGNLVTNAIKFT